MKLLDVIFESITDEEIINYKVRNRKIAKLIYEDLKTGTFEYDFAGAFGIDIPQKYQYILSDDYNMWNPAPNNELIGANIATIEPKSIKVFRADGNRTSIHPPKTITIQIIERKFALCNIILELNPDDDIYL